MIIRPVDITDIDELAAPLSELGAVTFTESFGHLYSAKDLSFFVNKNHSETAYRRDITDTAHHISVAQTGKELVGYISLGPNHLPCDPPVQNSVELTRLYIRSDHQSQGIGQKLIDWAVPHAQGLGFKNMVLSVWSENFAGHRFYERNGFEKIGEYQFPVGDHLDDEWILLKTL